MTAPRPSPLPPFVAIVPARSYPSAKTRLSPLLDWPARASLAREMLEHVVTVLRAVDPAAAVFVATDAACVAEHAAALGASVLLDPPGATLGEVVRIALDRLEPAPPRLVCMADLPWLSRAEVDALVAAARRGEVGLAPDHHHRGTNALALPAGLRLPTRFGTPDSLRAHLAAARDAQREVCVLDAPGTARDLDTPEDWGRWAVVDAPLAALGS